LRYRYHFTKLPVKLVLTGDLQTRRPGRMAAAYMAVRNARNRRGGGNYAPSKEVALGACVRCADARPSPARRALCSAIWSLLTEFALQIVCGP
jgi:hypothetical protein